MFPKLTTLSLAALLVGRVLAAEPQVITIKTLPAQMRYDITEFTVAPGADVKIVFENADDMPHNLVFFQTGTDVVAVSNKNLEKADEALKRDWLPVDDRMFAHSKMVGPKEKQEFTFKAPEKGGSYPYVCTFPAHAMSMQGKMRVAQPGGGLKGLKFAVYQGDWQKLPDFAALKPHREGTVADNLVQLKFDDYKNQFGLVFSAKITAPKDGDYTFSITGDDGVRVLVDGKKVVEYDGIHPAGDIKEGKVKLTAGDHDYRLEYFQQAGQSELFAGWSGPDFTMTPFSKWVPATVQTPKKKKEEAPSIPLVVTNEAVLYRNFITGSGGRPIAVGYPGGFNLSWSVDQLNVALLWRGAFMDAGKHWTDRGGGDQAPLGFDVVRPAGEVAAPFAILSAPTAPWPAPGKGRADDFAWKGYELDAKRIPTFAYTWGTVKVTDRFEPAADAATSGKFERVLKLAGTIPANAFLRLGTGTVTQTPTGFLVDAGKLDLKGRGYENQILISADGAQLAGGNLLVPARAEIRVSYTWPVNHAAHGHAH